MVRLILLLASAAVLSLAAAGPAFATPNATFSAAQSPPYWGPIGNTTDSRVGGSTATITFVIPDKGTVTCSSALVGYVPATATQLLITDAAFNTCTSNFGTADVTTATSSTTPWQLHLRTNLPFITGTLGLPAGAPLSIQRTDSGFTCDLTVFLQSLAVNWTNATHVLAVNALGVNFTGSGGICPETGTTMQIAGSYTFGTETETDNLQAGGKISPPSTNVAGASTNASLTYSGLTLKCPTSTIAGTTKAASDMDAALTFGGGCTGPFGIKATVSCKGDMKISVTTGGSTTSAQYDLNSGFDCTVTIASICSISVVGAQKNVGTGTLNESTTVLTMTLSVSATSTGGVCGTASGTATIAASYTITPNYVEIIA